MKFSRAACVTLALFLLFTTATEAAALLRAGTEIRCQCVKLETNKISNKIMEKLEVIPSGPYCQNVEVIITLKGGNQVCVDPSAPWIERIIKLALERQTETEAV